MPEPLRLALTLLPVGVCVGMIGSIVGAGGGFFIVPFLLLTGRALLGKEFTPLVATGTSLAVVLLNAASATSMAARLKRIDYRMGLAFAAATIPGAYAGRILLRHFSPGAFQALFAVLLVGLAVYLVARPPKDDASRLDGTPREIVEITGETHRYRVPFLFGILFSAGVGVLSSIFGVGGGIFMVPVFVLLFGMPTHIATATSQFILMFTSATGATEAAVRGNISLEVLFWMGLGVAAGAQIGIHLAKKVRGHLVRWMLAAVLGAVAVQMALNSGLLRL